MESTLQPGKVAPAFVLDSAPPSVAKKRSLEASAIDVRVTQGVAGLMGLERDWNTLLASQLETSFSQSFAWQMACVRHLPGAVQDVHFFSFYADGRVIGIFPLRRVLHSVGGISLWLWALPTHAHISLIDPLIAPDIDAAPLIHRLSEALNQRGSLPWHGLHLPNLPGNSALLRSLLAHRPAMSMIENMGQSMYFDCRDIETAMRNCSSAFRRNLRRQRKKLEQHGKVTLSLARRGPELEAAFIDFLRLEASGWKGEEGKGSAIRLHPYLMGFYTELRDGFGWEDGCHIFLLKLDGVAVAAQFCLLAGGTLSIQKIAYDQTWQAEAPGSLLMRETLDYACADPTIHRLSLVTAPNWAKGRWNPECIDVQEIHVFNRRPRSLLAAALRWGKHRFAEPWQKIRQQLTRTAPPQAPKGEN